MMRRSLFLPMALGLLACRAAVVAPPEWPLWSQAERAHPRRATIDTASQVIEHREAWRGPADLSAQFLFLHGAGRVTLLGEITDDRPLQQGRPERPRPQWWLMRVGADAVTLTVTPSGDGEAIEATAVLGSAGISPAVVDGESTDEIEVWPTPTGARVRLVLDLSARGVSSVTGWSADVTVQDVDGAADWSVHRERLR